MRSKGAPSSWTVLVLSPVKAVWFSVFLVMFREWPSHQHSGIAQKPFSLLIFFKTFGKFFKGPLSLHRASQGPISLSSLIAVVLVTRQKYKGGSRKHTD